MAEVKGSSHHHECALCMEAFSSPRLLPCFHTFCLGCLQRLVHTEQRSETLQCPTCRSTIPIPDGGVEKFQVNFYIETGVESQRSDPSVNVRVCEMCQKNVVTHKCADCDQFACSTCIAVHAFITATRSHTVLQLESLMFTKGSGPSHVRILKERYCSIHREEKIRFFCNECSATICRECKLVSHKQHATVDLSVRTSAVKQLIDEFTKVSRKNLEPKLKQQLKRAGDHRKLVWDREKELLALLERRGVELKEEIDKSLSQARQQLGQESRRVDKTVAACIDSMNKELAGFVSLTEHAERVAQGGCEADILEMPKVLRQFFGDEVTPHSQKTWSQSGAGDTVVGKSACKLKSFTDCKWKTVMQMEDETTECTHCHHRYDRALYNCPCCMRMSNSNLLYSDNGQCSKCRKKYKHHFQFCPDCGERKSDDVRAVPVVQKAVQVYIGRLVSSGAEGGEGTVKGTAALGSFSRPLLGYTPQPVNKISDTVSSQIAEEISALQSRLCKWQ